MMLMQAENNLTQQDFERLSGVVHRHCGINLHQGKRELVHARLAKLLRASPFDTASEYVAYVLHNKQGPEFSSLIDALSTNLTSFFRESVHFDYLGKVFIPTLLRKKQKLQQPRIRGWSAACSSGEEAYTMAMTLLDALPAHTEINTRILATDISNRMLATARAGTYDRARVASVPVSLKSKYLTASARNREIFYEPVAAVRDIVQFSYLNLMEPWPFKGPFDFIFCRNVMIYFDKPTQQQLVDRLYDVLDSGGLLFTGHSESLTGISHKFKYVQSTIYVKP